MADLGRTTVGATIHFARLENSKRLQRLLDYLKKKGSKGATTRDIVYGARIMAVSVAICELRHNGFRIDCESEGKRPTGSHVYRYKLIGA